MWELHKILQNSIKSNQEFLIDTILDMLNNMSEKEFIRSIKLMYGDTKIDNGLVAADMFVSGLKYNNFFRFEDFIRTLNS
jgi:hypothetical protein